MKTVKQFIKNEIDTLKNGVTLIEYISWWVLRVLQTGALIHLIKTNPTDGNVLLLSLNLLATFTVPLARIILFPKKLICRLPFRCQTWLNVMIFFGSFLAQGMRWNWSVTSFDKILHTIAGVVILFIGNELINMFLSEGEKISPLMRTFSATGFSYMAIVIWEIFEFFVDFYWVDSSNQAYNISPDRDKWFFVIFGYGAQNENQWAVFDTCVDMLCAVVGAMPAAIVLLVYLYKKEKKNTQTEEELSAA